jgi:hypothetical protein
MPILVQVSIAAAALAFVALAVAVIRTLSQLRATAAQVERTMNSLDHAIPEIERAVLQARGVIDTVGNVADKVDRVSGEFAATGTRLARASSMVIDEVIDPATKVAALVRGVRTGAGFLVNSYFKRRHAGAVHEGGNHHE